MNYYAIIVAGGSGSRMNAVIPKQFILLNEKPVLMHTIKAFYSSYFKPEIILVINSSFISLWEELCRAHKFEIPHTIVPGGVERFHSVKNALQLVEEGALVAIHDAVRPIVDDELISRVYRLAQQQKAVIPVVESKDSVRLKVGNFSNSVNRKSVLLVQTPQTFYSSLLKLAYEQEFNSGFTDDASVVESYGHPLYLTEGDYKNIEITYPEDLEIASLFLKIMP